MRINVVLNHSHRRHLLTPSFLKPMRGSRSHLQINPSPKNVQILVVSMYPQTMIVADSTNDLYASTDLRPASLWNVPMLYSRQPREVCLCTKYQVADYEFAVDRWRNHEIFRGAYAGAQFVDMVQSLGGSG